MCSSPVYGVLNEDCFNLQCILIDLLKDYILRCPSVLAMNMYILILLYMLLK